MITKISTHKMEDEYIAIYFSFFNHKHYKGSITFEDIDGELVSDGLEFFGYDFSKPLRDIINFLKSNTKYNKIKVYSKFEEYKKFEKFLIDFKKEDNDKFGIIYSYEI